MQMEMISNQRRPWITTILNEKTPQMIMQQMGVISNQTNPYMGMESNRRRPCRIGKMTSIKRGWLCLQEKAVEWERDNLKTSQTIWRLKRLRGLLISKRSSKSDKDQTKSSMRIYVVCVWQTLFHQWREEGSGCDFCPRWFHSTCVNATRSIHKKMEEPFSLVTMHHFLHLC